jgi:inner membrane protein
MDPLSQGVVGATLAQNGSSRRQLVAAALLGGLGGMAADLDVLIRSDIDPLLFLEYHRQFTHSLVFIPLGGLLCALVLHLPLGRRQGISFLTTLLFCTLGYATHALLDTCTTYGTQLLWPFSDARFAWNTISIIDPLFTLPILAAVVVAAVKQQPRWAQFALLWGIAYMGAGLWQRNAAVEMGHALAAQRGHQPVRLEAKPSFANIMLWKIVYETSDNFYVDAVRTGFWPRVFTGDSVPRLDVERDLPWLEPGSQQAQDVERFRWFSNGYIAKDPQVENRVIDIRYSLLPNEVAPLWSIELNPGAGPEEHVGYRVHREPSGERAGKLWSMLGG